MVNQLRTWIRLVEGGSPIKWPSSDKDGFVLHHNGPARLPGGRPTGPAYFGTEEFSDQNGYNFGPMRYLYWASSKLKILNLNDPSPERKEFLMALCEELELPPEECDHVINVDDDSFDIIYNEFSNSRGVILPLITRFRLDGLRFQDEFLLTDSAIKKLIKLTAWNRPEPYPNGYDGL